jgi:hypothetical protein
MIHPAEVDAQANLFEERLDPGRHVERVLKLAHAGAARADIDPAVARVEADVGVERGRGQPGSGDARAERQPRRGGRTELDRPTP